MVVRCIRPAALRLNWVVGAWLVLTLMLYASCAQAKQPILGNSVKKNANNALALMSFGVVPDLTSSFLSFQDRFDNTSRLSMTQFAGGETLGKRFPIYLEGSASFMRLDPKFVFTQGAERRSLPARWNAVSGTAGIGWDFELTPNLVLRPIFNFSLGHLESDLSLLSRFVGVENEAVIRFLENGRMSAYGLGGSLMLDYTLVKQAYEVDVELRYTNIELRTFDAPAVVRGRAGAEALSFYSRYRAPTGLTVMDRPLRYVLELASTVYLGDQRGLLGFNYLSSVGVGIEFDSSAKTALISRTRLVARYAFGENVRGFAIGLAVSF
jgi:hypothetical protein